MDQGERAKNAESNEQCYTYSFKACIADIMRPPCSTLVLSEEGQHYVPAEVNAVAAEQWNDRNVEQEDRGLTMEDVIEREVNAARDHRADACGRFQGQLRT